MDEKDLLLLMLEELEEFQSSSVEFFKEAINSLGIEL